MLIDYPVGWREWSTYASLKKAIGPNSKKNPDSFSYTVPEKNKQTSKITTIISVRALARTS